MKSHAVSLGLRLCLRCLTRLTCLLTRYTWSKKGLRRPYATPVLHEMQLTPQRELTRCILCTMDIYYVTTSNLRIWMLKKHLRMRTKKKARRQKQASSSSTSSSSSSRPAAAAAGNGEVEVEGRCAQTTLYIEVFNHTLPLTQRFRRRRHVGYWWKRTQELTRSLRAGTHKNHLVFLMSVMEV